MEAQGDQLLDQGDGEVRFALVEVARLQAARGLKIAEEQGERRRAEHAVGVDRDHAVGQGVQIANGLVGDVVGGLALLAIAGLVETEDEGGLTQRLTGQFQPHGAQRLHRPVGVGEEMVQRLGIGCGR